MENSGEFSIPPETKIQPNRQESLQKQLDTLDFTRPDHQVLGSVLTDIYQNYQSLDEKASKSENIRYQPRCANQDTVTDTDFGSYSGSYEYTPIIDALDNIPDPYNIFPKIETTIKESKDLSTSEIVGNIAETITKNTDVPVIVEAFKDYDQPYDKLENGNVYFHKNSQMAQTLGVHSKQYELTQDGVDFKNPKGDVVLINQLLSDNPAVIRTGIHELGHIVEEKTLKEDQEPTEVVSSLYGIKAGLLMSEIDPAKAADIIHGQVILYNWIMTGTTAP
jgi:hypothetical protein